MALQTNKDVREKKKKVCIYSTQQNGNNFNFQENNFPVVLPVTLRYVKQV